MLEFEDPDPVDWLCDPLPDDPPPPHDKTLVKRKKSGKQLA